MGFRAINNDKLPIDDFLYLESWGEIRGKLQKISEDDYYLYLDIDDKILVFNKESIEGSFLKEKLRECHIGKEIAILKTDIPNKSILIQYLF